MDNMGSQALNFVNLDDQDDDDLCVLYVKPVLRNKGCNSSNPILVERYSEDKDLSFAIMSSLSTQRRTKRVIDLSHDYFNCDHQDDDDVQVIASFPRTKRKIFKGESSNFKPANVNQIVDDDDLRFLCDICVDEKPKIEFFPIKGCSHTYCFECMAKYVSSKLQENNTNITCPAVGCSGRLEPQDCRSILPSQVFDRWGDVLCEAMILASEKFYCPFKDCSALLVDDRIRGQGEEVITISECPNCWRSFCAVCRVPWHWGIECGEFQKLNKDEREREDIMLMNLAKDKNWKRCPKCRIFVEKSQGCMFMKCRCGCCFCYKCGSHTPVNHRCSICKT